MAPEVAPSKTGFLPVTPGRQIFYEYFEGPSRETVCLLNGLAMHTKAWYPFLPQLLPSYGILLFDYFGQGESSSEDEPYLIPDFAGFLMRILDRLSLERIHLMGISYGGFVGLDFARLYQERLLTLTLSGILLSRERLFDLYQELSLRFYRSKEEVFDIYTQYMYEKIFGEAFVRSAWEKLETMRLRFFERYRDKRHALIRLTEAQNPFFASLEENLEGYRAIRTPTLILAGAEDRAIPPWVQEKIVSILPNARYEEIEGSGHVVYLEKTAAFFERLGRFLATRDPAA